MRPTASQFTRRALGLVAALAAIAIAGVSAQAQTASKSPLEIAAATPVEIAELMAGGSWQDAGKTGIFRGIVVVTGPNDAPRADVFVQWIGMKAEGGTIEIVQSMAIKEIADKKLTNAQIAIEADKDDEAMFLVTTYDAEAKPQVLAFKAGKPGQITATELPPSVQGQPGAKP